LCRDFTAERPYAKRVTDITEVKTADEKLYIPVIKNCFNDAILGLYIGDKMKAGFCVSLRWEVLRWAIQRCINP
jgi:transposase InsO family protein